LNRKGRGNERKRSRDGGRRDKERVWGCQRRGHRGRGRRGGGGRGEGRRRGRGEFRGEDPSKVSVVKRKGRGKDKTVPTVTIERRGRRQRDVKSRGTAKELNDVKTFCLLGDVGGRFARKVSKMFVVIKHQQEDDKVKRTVRCGDVEDGLTLESENILGLMSSCIPNHVKDFLLQIRRTSFESRHLMKDGETPIQRHAVQLETQ